MSHLVLILKFEFTDLLKFIYTYTYKFNFFLQLSLFSENLS